METLALHVVASCATAVPDCEDTSNGSATFITAFVVIGVVVIALVVVGVLTMIRSTRRR